VVSRFALSDVVGNRRWIRRPYPFPHLVADGVFTPDAYDAFAEATLKIVAGRPLHYLPTHDTFSYNVKPGTDTPLRFFLSKPWRDLAAGLAGVKPHGPMNFGVHHHQVGSASGVPHTDLRRGWLEDGLRQRGHEVAGDGGTGLVGKRREVVRGVAVLVYLANEPWQPGDGGETGLYRSAADAVDRPAAAVAPVNNRVLAFECTPTSYHSFLCNRRSPRNSLIMWVYRRPADLVAAWTRSGSAA
jgi:hypothetical protein